MKRSIGATLLPGKSKWAYWLSLAFISRLIFFLLVIHFSQYSHFPGFWGGLRGDSEGYLLPFENLIKTGSYTPDYRMPGFGVLYYPLILVFSKAIACNILIIIQLLLSSLSVYALALTVKKLFKSNTLFYLSFFIYTTSIFSSIQDPVLISESLTTSTLILSIYFFTRYFDEYKVKELIFSGTFLTWTTFLRPIFAPLFLVLFVLAIAVLVRSKKRIISAFLFLLPIIITDGAWMVRNYIDYKKIAPLTKTVYFPWIENSHLKSEIEFIQSWGGAIWFVDPKAEISWFNNNTPCTFGTGAKSDSVPFPAYIYTSQFNADSLKVLKNMISGMTGNYGLSVQENADYQNIVIEKFNRYTLSERKENPYIYYIKSNEKRLNALLFNIHPVTKLYINNTISKFYNTYYYIILCLGFIGILLMLPLIFKLSLSSIIPAIPVFTILIHAVVIRENENRYLIPAYPFIIICAGYCIYWLLNKLSPSLVNNIEATDL